MIHEKNFEVTLDVGAYSRVRKLTQLSCMLSPDFDMISAQTIVGKMVTAAATIAHGGVITLVMVHATCSLAGELLLGSYFLKFWMVQKISG